MRQLSIALAAALLAAAGCSTSPDPVLIGAVYPTGGSQGAGGLQELRGVQLAVRLANSGGGLDGRPFQLVESPADAAEAAPGAVESVVSRGASVVLGSYGSTISAPAAETSAGLDAVFWETGAVGEIDEDARPGERFFRVVSPGTSLGVAAVGFVEDTLLPKMEVRDDLRYAVVYVDDAYGRTIGHGALAEIERRGLGDALDIPYRLDDVDFDALAQRLLRARTDVLVVAAYLEDGIEMRRAVLRADVPLVASIGTSSSYCMHAFGVALGEDAIGLFASDKPDGETLDPAALTPEAGDALRWATETYERENHHAMTAAALSGFASAWALFTQVLPRAASLAPDDIAEAATAVRLPEGGLPNGSGLQLMPPGGPAAGTNARATSVIWEWVELETRAIVWPPELASSPVLVHDIS